MWSLSIFVGMWSSSHDFGGTDFTMFMTSIWDTGVRIPILVYSLVFIYYILARVLCRYIELEFVHDFCYFDVEEFI